MTSQHALFRQEAVEFQRDQRQWGEVVLLQPLSTKVAAWGAVASVAVMVMFLFVAPYARKETVAGFLLPTAGIARVHVPRPGMISGVHVREGQEVEEGQPLLSIASDQVAGDGTDVNAAILASLAQQRDLLWRQIEAEDQRDGLRTRARLGALIEGLQGKLSHLEAQATTQAERIRLAEGMVATAARLNPRGYVSELDLRRREEAMLEHRQNLDALGQQRAARRNQLTETHSALEQLPVSAAERLRSLRGELAAVEQRIAEINGRRAYVIRAPIAGRVRWARPRTPGACSSASSPRGAFSRPSSLSRLTPSVSCVPGRRSGSLTKAFPYQHFGTYRGRIANVSQTILTDAEAAGPVRLNEPAYRVTASLERQDVDAAGERMPLQPDMLLRADIILDRRPLMAWIMGPLLAGTRGMHR